MAAAGTKTICQPTLLGQHRVPINVLTLPVELLSQVTLSNTCESFLTPALSLGCILPFYFTAKIAVFYPVIGKTTGKIILLWFYCFLPQEGGNLANFTMGCGKILTSSKH